MSNLPQRWPSKGDRMTFLGENGYEHQLVAALKIFETGREYEVEDCEVHDWSHDIKFVGIKGRFNGVMFKLEPRSPAGNDAEKILDHKWLDAECVEKGCQSLVWKGRYESAVKGRADFRDAYREARLQADDDKFKLVYIKRWRTLFKIPASIADEVRDTLNGEFHSQPGKVSEGATAVTQTASQLVEKEGHDLRSLATTPAASTKSAPAVNSSLPSGESDLSVTLDCAGTDTAAKQNTGDPVAIAVEMAARMRSHIGTLAPVSGLPLEQWNEIAFDLYDMAYEIEAKSRQVEELRSSLKSVSNQCGNVIFNCEQRPADNDRHLSSWRGVKEFADASLKLPSTDKS